MPPWPIVVRTCRQVCRLPMASSRAPRRQPRPPLLSPRPRRNEIEQTFALQSVEAPAIVSFALTDATGASDAGDEGSALTVVATVSEAFTLTLNDAAPTITLNFGETSATATYVNHDGAAGTITFSATAPAGDASSTSITAIDLGAATLIGDLSGQPLITDAYGSANTSYTLDNTAPSL